MISVIPERLRKPAAYALGGAAFAVAWAVRGGPTWWISILAAIVTVIRVVTVYMRGGQDSDEGALAGSRADERLALVAARSWALAGKLAVIAAFVGLVIGIAARQTWWWPFAIMLGVTSFFYLLGLSNNGFGDEGPTDEATDGLPSASSVCR